MPRGGAKPGERRGGRQKGTPNAKTAKLEKAQQAAAQRIGDAIGEDAFKGDSWELLCAIYKDQRLPLDVRLDAAKAAISFERNRLSAVEHSGNPDKPMRQVIEVEWQEPNESGFASLTSPDRNSEHSINGSKGGHA